jgi:acyl carrier protein
MKINKIDIITMIINEASSIIDLENDEINFDTTIYGNDSRLDSLGLVNLIVAVEQNIEDEFDVNITIADERAMSQKHSPFTTIGSLANYIEMLLKEELND